MSYITYSTQIVCIWNAVKNYNIVGKNIDYVLCIWLYQQQLHSWSTLNNMQGIYSFRFHYFKYREVLTDFWIFIIKQEKNV